MTVEQLAWTLTALLGAGTLGNLYYLGARIDHQAARIDGVIEQISALRGEIGDMLGEVRLLRRDFEGHRGDHHTH